MLAIQMIPKGGSIPEAIDNKAFFAALSTQILNNPDRIMKVNDKQYDYATLIINGLLSAGMKNNAIYVDSIFGDDTTAEKNNLEKKYKTILAAETAAVAGETIVTFPGNYVENFLGKNGLNYSFPFGANVQCAWTGGNLNYTVTGFADFSSSFHSPVNAYLNSNINIQCKSITGMRLGFPAVFASSGCKVNVQVFGDINHTLSDTVQSTDFNTELHVTANRILSTGRACSVIAGGTTGHKQFVYAKEIILSGAAACVNWSNGGYQELHIGKYTRIAGATVGNIILQQGFFPSTPIVNIYGDIQDDSALTVDVNNNNGLLTYFGNIAGNGNISVTGSSAFVKINGEVVISKDAGVISMSAGTVEVKGKLKNIMNTANAHGIVISGGTPILNQAVIVTTNAGTNSLYAAALRNAIVYTGFANKAKHANVTTLVGALVVDANVI